MKKIIAVLLVICMLFVLNACGGDNESTSTGEITEVTTIPTDSTVNATDGSEDNTQGIAEITTGEEYTESAESAVTMPLTTTPPIIETSHTHSYSAATCTDPAKCSCGETNGSALGHNFVKGVCLNCNLKAKTQQITITTENWEQYFEVKIINNAKKNSFGDYGTPQDFSIAFKLFLKEKYIEKLASIDVSIELSYDDYVESYTYDSSTGNYTLTGEQSYFAEKRTFICNFTDNDNNYYDGCYFSDGCWGGGDETTGYITRYAKNITSTRTTGTITLMSD